MTANSKIDKKTLTALAGELDVVEDNYDAPNSPTEQRLAAAWAKVLGIPQDQIGRNDHFFDRGGTSLSAVKLAVNLDRAFSLKDLTGHPVLADLAALVDGRSERAPSCCSPCRIEWAGIEWVGIGRCGRQRFGVLPVRGRQRGELPADGSGAAGSGMAVYAVELPGHDVAAGSEPFAPMERVVEQVVAEITARGLKEVLLWGHPPAPRSPWKRPEAAGPRGGGPAGVPCCATAR